MGKKINSCGTVFEKLILIFAFCDMYHYDEILWTNMTCLAHVSSARLFRAAPLINKTFRELEAIKREDHARVTM